MPGIYLMMVLHMFINNTTIYHHNERVWQNIMICHWTATVYTQSTHVYSNLLSKAHTFRWLRLSQLVMSTLDFYMLYSHPMAMRCRCQYTFFIIVYFFIHLNNLRIRYYITQKTWTRKLFIENEKVKKSFIDLKSD